MVGKKMSIQLSVVVPVHNENENLRPLIEEIVAAVSGLGAYEIIYVDDGSTDDTAQIAERYRMEVDDRREKSEVRSQKSECVGPHPFPRLRTTPPPPVRGGD